MTTQEITATDEWVDIVSTLGLTEGSSYLIQNTGSTIAYLTEQATAPTGDSGYHIYASRQVTVLVATGLALYVKTPLNADLIVTPVS